MHPTTLRALAVVRLVGFVTLVVLAVRSPAPATLALVALALLALVAPTLAHRPRTGVPFAPLAGGAFIGLDWLARHAGATTVLARGGLVDSVEQLRSPALDPARVPDAVRAYFEHASAFDLVATPVWSAWFVPLAWIWRRAARWVGQFELPASRAAFDTQAFALRDDPRDVRAARRGIVRTYAEGGRPMQVATYGVHTLDGVGYMNCAFPVPLGNLTGVLRLDPITDRDGRMVGAALSSHPRDGRRDDAGVWFVFRGRFPVRLPVDERLAFWPAGANAGEPDAATMPGATVVGRHVMQLLGATFVTTTYLARPRAPAA